MLGSVRLVHSTCVKPDRHRGDLLALGLGSPVAL